jgi:hypothetical protein
MGSDILQRAVHAEDVKQGKKVFQSSLVGILVTCVVFFVPVAIFYRFLYFKTTVGLFSGLALFFVIYVAGALANALFYRMVILGDEKMQIDKMSMRSLARVFSITFAGFLGILGITMSTVALNPSMVDVFENTIGFWYISGSKLSELLAKLFVSPTFDKFNGSLSYDFLITKMNQTNIDSLIGTIEEVQCGDDALKTAAGFDFTFKKHPQAKKNIDELRELVDLKYSVGHFTWVYIGSVFSLMVSMVALIMDAS